jgi:hypothetical protein
MFLKNLMLLNFLMSLTNHLSRMNRLFRLNQMFLNYLKNRSFHYFPNFPTNH